MEKAQSELIQELFDSGCITKQELDILHTPQSVTLVVDIKSWIKSLDENVTYDDSK